jgi:uncharacterized protein YbbC (DUF1343 family)
MFSINSAKQSAWIPELSLLSRIVCLAAGVWMTLFANQAQAQPSATEEAPRHSVLAGLDVLESENFQTFRKKKVAVVTDRTAVSKNGRGIGSLLFEQPEVDLATVFCPLDETWEDSSSPDSAMRFPYALVRLHPPDYAIPPERLKSLDALIHDVQDLGIRTYPRLALLTAAMRAAASASIPLYVLDRPDPMGGTRVRGPLPEPNNKNLYAQLPIPIQYALTPGELARLIQGEGWLGIGPSLDLRIVEMQGWKRGWWLDETDLPWACPEPGLLNLSALAFYPGMRLLDGTNLSRGQGTFQPYLQVGAPWIEAATLAKRMNAPRLPGFEFMPTRFTPEEAARSPLGIPYAGQSCYGLAFQFQSRQNVDSIRMVMNLLSILIKNEPEQFQFNESFSHLTGRQDIESFLRSGGNPDMLLLQWRDSIRDYARLRNDYLIYR